MVKKVERDGDIYDVIDETASEYKVRFITSFAGKKRIMEVWWCKECCNIVEGKPKEPERVVYTKREEKVMYTKS